MVYNSINHHILDLRGVLSKISVRKQAILQQVPSHCGVSGNERSDRLAKGRECRQADNEVSYLEEKKVSQIIRAPEC